MQEKTGQGTKEAQVVHYAKAHVGARDRRRRARTPQEKSLAALDEYESGKNLEKAVRGLPP
ncbi:hypothetical protein [Rugamonas sp.]|uniref:hypothetical protein n=1 Tax=Rugamonas sp. TaxID=1926287 RepID=UPI0025FF856F|nr:hypothetical protein [Rugamonas sp.]